LREAADVKASEAVDEAERAVGILDLVSWRSALEEFRHRVPAWQRYRYQDK